MIFHFSCTYCRSNFITLLGRNIKRTLELMQNNFQFWYCMFTLRMSLQGSSLPLHQISVGKILLIITSFRFLTQTQSLLWFFWHFIVQPSAYIDILFCIFTYVQLIIQLNEGLLSIFFSVIMLTSLNVVLLHLKSFLKLIFCYFEIHLLYKIQSSQRSFTHEIIITKFQIL